MGKQLLLDALQGKKTERAPWVPFIGCHGATLIGKNADEYLRSGDLIAQGIRTAISQYRPDGVSVTFDLQLEAEALGCELQWAQEKPPTIVGHVLERTSLEHLQIPDEHSGRIPEILKAIRLLKADGHDLALYGLITGPFTLALHLKGTSIFMEMYDKPNEVRELLQFCANVAKRMAQMYIDAGCDVIASVEPMASQISSRAFTEFIAPYATDIFEDIRRLGALSSFFVCGHAQRNVEVMCQCKPDNVSVDENIPLDFVKEVSQRYGISFGGNLQLTVMLLMGSEDDVHRHTLETIDFGGNTGFVLAPGCDLPIGVPPANVRIVADVVHGVHPQSMFGKQRISLDNRETRAFDEHETASQVIVEIVTLDSEALAPSQYTIEAVRDVADYFGNIIVWREHTLTENELSEHMLGIMVKNVPTICIDGEIRFVGTIPAREELIQAIQDRLDERSGTYSS